jgi:hypothetical protein
MRRALIARKRYLARKRMAKIDSAGYDHVLRLARRITVPKNVVRHIVSVV